LAVQVIFNDHVAVFNATVISSVTMITVLLFFCGVAFSGMKFAYKFITTIQIFWSPKMQRDKRANGHDLP
jgi:hypothetical protein